LILNMSDKNANPPVNIARAGNVDGTTSGGEPSNNGVQLGTTEFSVVNPGVDAGERIELAEKDIDIDVEKDTIVGIKDFLAKPIPIWLGQVSTTDTENQVLYSSSLLSLVTSNALWWDKLKGFLNFRADVKLRLTLNTNPFQAGLVRMMYFPNEGTRPGEARGHMYNIVTNSQLPGVFLPFSDDGVELTVPYASPTYYVQVDRIGADAVDWGKVYVVVYAPMRTGSSGPTSAACTLWMSLENLELAGQLHPQSRGNVSDRETNGGRGTISSIMSTGRDFVKSLSGVPSVGGLTEPTAWALDIASRAASALGWSKPTLSSDPTMMAVGGNWRSINVDGGDMSAPLSYRTDNKLKVISDGHTSGTDELSFDYVHSKWGAIRLFDWGASDAVGTLLQTFEIGPQQFYVNYTVGGRQVKTLPPCSFGREFFSMYRGSFDLNFKFVKTGYHSGSLAFCWVPGIASSTPTYAQTAFLHREIVSLQGGSDFCFSLPYLLGQDYINCEHRIGKLCVYVVNPLVAPETCNPTIRVYVEARGGQDLEYSVPKAIESVPYYPQSIKAGGPSNPVIDFTLSGQESHGWFVPIYGDAVLCVESGSDMDAVLHLLEIAGKSNIVCVTDSLEGSGTIVSICAGVFLYIPPGIPQEQADEIQLHACSSLVLKAQAISTEEKGERVCVALATKSIPPRRTAYAERSIGEQIQSYREILKSEYFMNRLANLVSGVPFTVDAHQLCAATYNSVDWYAAPINGDHVSLIASVFGFMRGGIRWRFNRITNTNNSSMRACLTPVWDWLPGSLRTTVTGPLLGALNGGTSTSRSSFRIFQSSGVNESLFVQAPFYCKWRWAMTNFRTDSSTGTKLYMPNNSICANSESLGQNFSFSRSVSDDFDMCFFIGVPSLVESSGTTLT
jgi:hypothetical protein